MEGSPIRERPPVKEFIEYYLNTGAQITLALDNGNIIYEGSAWKISPDISKRLNGLYVNNISLGSMNDIFITLTRDKEKSN